MRKLITLVFLLCCTAKLFAQYSSSTVNTGGTGWRKVAYIDSPNKRGFGKITIYTSGGTHIPTYSDIYWYSNWDNVYTLRMEGIGMNMNYWTAVRFTEDNDRAYIEVNFGTNLIGLTVMVDDYGFYPAKLYTGTLPESSGTVRHEIRYGHFNIANQFIMNEIGNVGIGTPGLLTAKLAVNGLIRSKEVKVETANWPDYVFNADYKLRSLTDIEDFIKENGHLPEVPKAKVIEEEGQSLGEMNRLLLQKVEELTLYIIEQDKRIKKLEEK